MRPPRFSTTSPLISFSFDSFSSKSPETEMNNLIIYHNLIYLRFISICQSFSQKFPFISLSDIASHPHEPRIP